MFVGYESYRKVKMLNIYWEFCTFLSFSMLTLCFGHTCMAFMLVQIFVATYFSSFKSSGCLVNMLTLFISDYDSSPRHTSSMY